MRDDLDWRFADMGEGNKRYWLAWARSHDWGVDTKAHWNNLGDTIVCYGAEHNAEYGWRSYAEGFRTPRAMRDWAGY